MEYYLQTDNKDIQTFEYFASETRSYDNDIHVIEISAYLVMQVKFRDSIQDYIGLQEKHLKLQDKHLELQDKYLALLKEIIESKDGKELKK